MKTVLFVDDEPRILEGLRRQLHRYRKEWEMVFAGGGGEALERMEERPFDVVVSDMRMPGIDGAELLRRVHQRHPGTVRIVLSGHSELESALRAIPIAHQFLSKPCDAEVIREVIRRACSLQALMEDARLQEAVGGIDSLPATPSVYTQLLAALADTEVSLDDVAAVVARDPSITAKILQLVNSSFFGIVRPIGNLREATAYLGMDMIRNLTLSVEVFRAFKGPAKGFRMEELQVHGTLCARIARRLLPDRRASESAFLAGTLHDIGQLVLATSAPDLHARFLETSLRTGQPLVQVEVDLTGTTHAEVGAYLLGIWGLPYTIIEAVANHHHPSRVESNVFDVVGAVHVASVLTDEVIGARFPADLDVDYLGRVGVLDRLPEWRAIAADEGRDSFNLAA